MVQALVAFANLRKTTARFLWFFFYWLGMLHYNRVILHAISYNVSYRGEFVLLTHFASPFGSMVFVIVDQSLLILHRLEMSPDASRLGPVCLQASVRRLWHSSS